MKTVFKKGEEFLIKDTEIRDAEAGEIRLKVDASGICGTDLHKKEGDVKERRFGHEVAGTIVALGAGVTGLELGQKVALDSSTPCGRCANCKNARQELCTNVQSLFKSGLFGMAEETIAPAISAVPFEGVSPEVACLQEPLGVAIDMVRLADIGIDSNVLVIGPGAIGLMAVALAKRAGARRIFVSGHRRRTRRVELAKDFGADHFVEADELDPEKPDFGCRIDRVMVTAPPRTLVDAFKIACKGGIVSFIGIEHGEGGNCTFDANAFHFKKLQLRASFASPALFGPKAIRYLCEGVVNGEALVSHRYPLEEMAAAVETARSDPSAVKVVITP